MGEVVILPVVTSLDIPVERVLGQALEKGMETAVIIGIDREGEFYFSSSISDGAEVLWWLEAAKKKLLEAGGL